MVTRISPMAYGSDQSENQVWATKCAHVNAVKPSKMDTSIDLQAVETSDSDGVNNQYHVTTADDTLPCLLPLLTDGETGKHRSASFLSPSDEIESIKIDAATPRGSASLYDDTKLFNPSFTYDANDKKWAPYIQRTDVALKRARRVRHPSDRNLLLAFIVTFIFLTFSFAVLAPALVIFLVVLPFASIYRRFSACLCCCTDYRTCACCTENLLTPYDFHWLQNLSHTDTMSQCILVMHKFVDTGKIQDAILNKVVQAEDKHKRKIYPRFTQHLVPLFTGYAWKNDESFNIENQVYEVQERFQSESDICDYVGKMAAASALDLTRPLWEIQVMRNVGASNTVLLVRFSPVLTDGISLVRILVENLSDGQAKANLKQRFGGSTFLFNSLRAAIVGPLIFLLSFLQRKDRNVLHGPELSGEKVVAWSDSISFQVVDRISQVTRSTHNDIVLCAIAGAIRSYLQRHHITNPCNITCTVPMDTRTDASKIDMGNELAYMQIKLPVNIAGAIPRLWRIRHSMDEAKSSCDSVVVVGASHILHSILPHSTASAIINCIFRQNTCCVNNLPGPVQHITIAEYDVDAIIPFMAPLPGQALSFNLFTYAEEMRFSLMADRALIPDPAMIVHTFKQQINMMNELLAYRRTPGEHRSEYYSEEGAGNDAEEYDQEEMHIDPLEEEIRPVRSRSASLASTISRQSCSHVINDIPDTTIDNRRSSSISCRKFLAADEMVVDDVSDG